MPSLPATPHDVARIATFVRHHPRPFVLTGAGVSTDSGIPAYRDDAGNWTRNAPITGPEFARSDAARRRYWARSMAGWPAIEQARPNAAHAALARLEAIGVINTLVTQNVDGLHQQAGSGNVLELHGSLRRVTCLDCGSLHAREAVQRALERENPGWAEALSRGTTAKEGGAIADAVARTMPDGDADVDAVTGAVHTFNVPHCTECGGILKPDVVFFGDNVPRERVGAAMHALEESDAMLVVGSSLAVYSGYRFCERAVATGKPIAAINRGRTRADALLTLKVERSCAGVLTALEEGLA